VIRGASTGAAPSAATGCAGSATALPPAFGVADGCVCAVAGLGGLGVTPASAVEGPSGTHAEKSGAIATAATPIIRILRITAAC
jgi:hypothetical protein